MDREDPEQNGARLSFAEGWTLLDALSDDPAGKRLLVQCADGVRRQVIEPGEDEQGSIAFRERFKRKAARARGLDHPNLAATLGYAEDAGTLFLVEPDLEGLSLAELMESEGALPADAVLEVGADLAQALEAVHRAGLVHGWVRPGAVLVSNDRACLRGAGLEHPKGENIGPPDFMSPEQLSEDRSLRAESDFFSLGSTLFAAIVGRPPFVGASPEEVADRVRLGSPRFPGPEEPQLSKNLRLLFAKLLAADPEQRPLTAEELVNDIEAVQRGERIDRATVQPPSPARPARPTKKRRPVWIIALAAVAAALVLVGLAFLLPKEPGHEAGPLAAGAATAPARVTTAPASTRPAAASTGPAAARPPAELAAEQYAEARRYAAAHPRRFDEIIRRFRDVAARYPGTDAALNAAREATDAELKKSGDRLSEFGDVQAEADRLVAKQRFGDAVAAYRRHEVLRTPASGELPAALQAKIQAQISFIESKAATAFDAARAKAAEAVKGERYETAIAIYEAVVGGYGLEPHVGRARKELALLRPLLEQRDKVAGQRRAQALEAAYRETAAETQTRVKAFDLEGAVAASEALAKELEGSALAPSAARHLGHLRRLLALKQRVIRQINRADPKLKSESLGIRAPASVIASADGAGIVLRSAGGAERRPWSKLSDWEKYAIARKVCNLDSKDDLAALGLLSLEQGNLARAESDLKLAKRFGGQVDDLLGRARAATTVKPEPGADGPARMLVRARARVGQKQWLDALALLIPLKEKHAVADYAIRQKLDEINALLRQCADGLARADRDRDIARGIETPLFAAGLAGWTVRGKGWTFKAGRASCDNRAEHDIDLVRPVKKVPAYRLALRCRVLQGNGLLVRVASDGDTQYDFWLGLADIQKSGLWLGSGGKVRKNNLITLLVRPGEWVTVRAVVTGREVRVECGGQRCRLPCRLDSAAAEWSVGLITRQKSKAEFEALRIRTLHEQ